MGAEAPVGDRAGCRRVKIRDVKIIVTCPGRNYVVVKIETDEPGIYGVGDATLNGRELAVATILREHIAPLLIGRDPDRIEDIWQYLTRGGYWRGGPVQMTAVSGIDLALWDIKGKVAGLPVYSLLGGRTRIGALAYGHACGATHVELLDEVRRRIDEGFRVVRVQVAVPGQAASYGIDTAYAQLGPETGIGDGGALPILEKDWEVQAYLRSVPRMLEFLRSELGDSVALCHDAHGRLTPIEAARLARDVEPFGLLFLEDPVRSEHRNGLELVRRSSTTPLAAGELYTSVYDVLDPITGQLIDYVRCDIAHVGGLTAARKIAAIAEPFGVRTAWHGPDDIGPAAHAANVHLNCSIPNFGVQEYPALTGVVLDVLPGAPELIDGSLFPSDAPGLGVDVDEKLAARFPYQRQYLPTVRLIDGSVHDW